MNQQDALIYINLFQ